MVFRHLDVVAESQENKSGNEKIKHRVFFFYFPLPLSETSTKTFYFFLLFLTRFSESKQQQPHKKSS
jgi:hypothetical protein